MNIKVNEVNVGDVLIAEDGLGCLDMGDERVVMETPSRDKFVKCRMAVHYIVEDFYTPGVMAGFRLKERDTSVSDASHSEEA